MVCFYDIPATREAFIVSCLGNQTVLHVYTNVLSSQKFGSSWLKSSTMKEAVDIVLYIQAWTI